MFERSRPSTRNEWPNAFFRLKITVETTPYVRFSSLVKQSCRYSISRPVSLSISMLKFTLQMYSKCFKNYLIVIFGLESRSSCWKLSNCSYSSSVIWFIQSEFQNKAPKLDLAWKTHRLNFRLQDPKSVVERKPSVMPSVIGQFHRASAFELSRG